MIGKNYLIILVLAVAMAAPLLYAGEITLDVSPCSDGTAYGACSQTQPGMVCWTGDNGHVLVSALDPNGLTAFKDKCACSKFPGYIESASHQCVKTTCTYNGASVNDQQCAADKPKRCVQGSIVDDANACGCPVGQQMKSNNVGCEVVAGSCRWKTLTCSPSQECKFVEADKTDKGTCTPKQGCAYGTVTCTSMQTCDTSTNPNGVCTTKPGCQYLNPPCAKGQTCNPVSGVCETGSSSGTTQILPNQPSSNTANATTTGGSSPLSCCCLPTVGGVGLVGLVAYQGIKRREEE